MSLWNLFLSCENGNQKMDIPLIIWGEPQAEMTAYFTYDELEEENEEKFNMFRKPWYNS